MVSFQATSCCCSVSSLKTKTKQNKAAGNSNYIENCRAQSPICVCACVCAPPHNFNQMNERKKRESARSIIEKQFLKIEIAYLQFVCVILKKDWIIVCLSV
jgi:hypothetical protein